MGQAFLEEVLTPAVLAEQEHYYKRRAQVPGAEGPDALTEEEQVFIETRDSFYIATITESGWPYVQHRGGARGFLHVVDAGTLAFADYRGNRQMLSTGNLKACERVSIILMDYPNRERLKILGHASVVDAKDAPQLTGRLSTPQPADRAVVERIFIIKVLGFDWNCSQFITPRYTKEEIESAILPLRSAHCAIGSQACSTVASSAGCDEIEPPAD